MSHTVAVVVGSLRKESFNRKIAKALQPLAGDRLRLDLLDVSDLPLYNEDLETASPPPSWTRLRAAVKTADAVLFVTPEYNRSMPGAMKNVLDVGSRPKAQNVFSGKPAAIISSSPGMLGGFGANHHLRQCLVALNTVTMAIPEMYVGQVSKWFDTAGELNNDDARKLLQSFVDAFVHWIDRHGAR